jgi:hypothetical protein
MDNKMNTKIILIVAVIIAVIILWYIYANNEKKSQLQEKFAQEEKEQNKEKMGEEPTEYRIPFINPQTGTLMDGPGFEKPLPNEPVVDKLSVIPSNYYFLDDGANGEFSIQHNMCSKSCCSEQWPTPFKQKYDPYVCSNKDKFVPSNIFCNNSFQDSGCLCLSNKQASFLYNRGGNGREWF